MERDEFGCQMAMVLAACLGFAGLALLSGNRFVIAGVGSQAMIFLVVALAAWWAWRRFNSL